MVQFYRSKTLILFTFCGIFLPKYDIKNYNFWWSLFQQSSKRALPSKWHIFIQYLCTMYLSAQASHLKNDNNYIYKYNSKYIRYGTHRWRLTVCRDRSQAGSWSRVTATAKSHHNPRQDITRTCSTPHTSLQSVHWTFSVEKKCWKNCWSPPNYFSTPNCSSTPNRSSTSNCLNCCD